MTRAWLAVALVTLTSLESPCLARTDGLGLDISIGISLGTGSSQAYSCRVSFSQSLHV